jgi:MSHA biogenesis protein MshP
MCNDLRTSIRKQRGISLLLVLFVLVIVSLLVAALMRLNTGSQKIISQEILSVRALFAAESGAQAAAMRLFPITGLVQPCNFAINFATAGLSGCTATVTCPAPVVAAGRTMYTVKSEGRCNGGTEQSRRMITVGLRAP